jgi:Family of unknown function (DUF6338)
VPGLFVGLILFLALLTPGTCYAFRRGAGSPNGPRLPAVLETARIVSVSLLSDFVALLLFFVVHHLRVPDVPNPWAVLKNPGPYFHAHPLRNVGWAGAFVLVACLLAVLLAVVVESSWFRSAIGSRWLSWLTGHADPGDGNQE